MPPFAPDQLTPGDYARAARFLPQNADIPIVQNATVIPHWLANSNVFWYRRDKDNGYTFRLVDAEKATNCAAFDHLRVAQILTAESGQSVEPDALPIFELSFVYDHNNGLSQFEFKAFERWWTCLLPEYRVSSENLESPIPEGRLASPSGLQQVFRRRYNLWIHDVESGEDRPLTTDGKQYNEYGWYSGNSQYYITAGLLNNPPLVLFSPDGNTLVTERVDERDVGKITLWQGAPESSNRPKVHEAHLSFAGDKHMAKRTLVIINIQNGVRYDIDQSFTKTGDIGSTSEKLLSGRVCWSRDSSKVYFLSSDRYFKTVHLSVFDLKTQTVTLLIEETSSTQVNTENSYSCVNWPAMRILDDGDILWFSDRTGWGHFYRYDKEGNLKNALTQGDWAAYEIPFVDEKRGLAYVLGVGREAERHCYYRQLYQVSLDGTGLRWLTPEDGDHAEADQFHQCEKGRFFSPSGDYFVDTWSTVSTVPLSVLKTTKGDVLIELETADINGLFPDNEWPHRPEVFQVKARDGQTDIFGEIFKPSNFDPNRQYPIIDHVYSSPYYIFPSWPSFTSRFWGIRQAYAELGFIVVVIHGFGTCGRSKAFHEHSYNNLQDSGIADHVSALEQLAKKHNYFDIDRVGIFGGSTGGYNTVLAMQDFPYFFKVGVSSVPGVDHPHLTAGLVERWQGPPSVDGSNYKVLSLANKVNKLKGNLLLAFADMDENVPMHTIVRFLDAMTKHNKDYDLIYLPNVDHWISSHPYFVRRSWDYFVRHLMGSEPPTEYHIVS